jgi:hypothetical protein
MTLFYHGSYFVINPSIDDEWTNGVLHFDEEETA